MYNSYFGFSESPFNVTPDPRFFYTNPVYLEAYANLHYGIEAKKGFIVITGEVGTGKTTLLRKLLHSLENTVHSVFIFNTCLSFQELLQVTLQDLGLAPTSTSKVTMLEQLNDYLIKQLKQSHNVTMLIDEAQDLSDEVLENLRLLSNLETDREKLLQIVLMGQPELETKLDQIRLRQLKQRVALRCRLGPLKDEEVGPYIDFRLRTARYEGTNLFHHDAVRQISFYSKGIPRLINIICDNALLISYAESKKLVSADTIKEVARDLRIASEGHVSKIDNVLAPKTERQTLSPEMADHVLHNKMRELASLGGGILLCVLVFVAVAFMIDPPNNLLSMAGRSLEVVKHNLNQESVPKKANAAVEFKRREQRVVIQYGATIYQIASEVYGTNAVLGMDLIKEFNPQIKNLNWVSAGQELLLPSLTQETLLRPQTDGTYHIIVASFRSRTGADEYIRLLSNQGHPVIITPKRVSDDLLLYRLEIGDLKNLEEANQIWQTGLKNEWLAFAGSAGETR
jgi:general secretion pathway protein A